MSNKDYFLSKYPMPLINLLSTPIIFKEGVLADENLPFPGIAHLKDLCRFGNYSYGAIRTAMTRARKKNLLNDFIDDDGIKRFRLSEYQRQVGKVVLENQSSIDNFSLAVFTFKASESSKRYQAREILGYFGFRMIAQNVYIRRRITGSHLEDAVKEEGFSNNIFIFECRDPATLPFKNKLYSQFNVKESAKKLHEFKDDLAGFIDPELEKMELARRIFYAGPVYHNICFEKEPPLPESYFPDDYPMPEVTKIFNEMIKAQMKNLVDYYMEIERSGAG